MPPQPPPLDEQEYDNPLILRDLPGGNLNSDSILWYFMNSQFYDGESDNHALVTQLSRSDEGRALMSNRHAFEDALTTRFPIGIRFIVVAEPQGPGQPWVIQRQRRYKPIDDNGHELDRIEVEVQATYYTVGTKILMAPSLLDILRTRLLSVSTHLQHLFELSKDLTHYSPATGHTYLPPSYEAAKAIAPGSASRIGSPGLAPEVAASQIPAAQPGLGTSTTEFSDELFLQSLAMTNHYGHEYMDENPLQGEPGSFVFTNTKGQVEARNKAQAAAKATGATLVVPPKPKEGESAISSVAPTPKPVPTPLPTEAGSRKESVASVPKLTKEKRRKSKGLTSPVSPTGPSG